MTDPRRFVEAPPDSTVLELLASAEHDDPSQEALHRTAAALGITALVGGAAAGTAGLASASSVANVASVSTTATSGMYPAAIAPAASAPGLAVAGKTAALSTKWLILGAVAALGAIGVVAATQFSKDKSDGVSAETKTVATIPTSDLDNPNTERETNAPGPATTEPMALAELEGLNASPKASPDSTQAPVPTTVAPSKSAAQKRSKNPRRASKKAPPRRATARNIASKLPAKSIAEEIAILDRARRQLAGGDARGALQSLDELGPAGASALGPEVSVLRIRALFKTGQKRTAARQARKFLTLNPASPHARELQAIASGKR
jgi:hypothetical protein